MNTTTTAPKIVGPQDGQVGFLGSIGVRFMIDGIETDQGFSLVEHPMSPRALAAPLHLHTREDEYSYVLEGRMGAQLGEQIVQAGPGNLVFKPRNQWHTFWNAGDEPCRILEIIAPAGFENFFKELDALGGAINADPDKLTELAARYGHYFQLDSVPELLQRFDLRIGEPLSGGWVPQSYGARRSRWLRRSARSIRPTALSTRMLVEFG
jgi:mannose-6-phosphate isomerase-like protein (cupin superfamily)